MIKKLGIEEVSSFIPEGRLEFSHKKEIWKLSKEFIEEKIGVRRVSRKVPGEKASDLALAAYAQLQKKAFIEPGTIELVVVVTQNPDKSIPHVSAILQAKIGAPSRCLAFDLSHGCAGYVYGLSVALALMREQGFTRALLFTADPYSEIINPEDRDTALLFGDGATVTLLSDSPKWECGKFVFHTEGNRAESLSVRGGALQMDGGDVFSFAAKQVPLDIAELLFLNRLSIEDIALFLLHSGSRYIVDTIAKRSGLPKEKVPFGIEDFGNTVSSSLPILLEKTFLPVGSNILLCGFGVGLASAGVILTKVK
jgi:3-oxoacyl-[acyl-carrier-protein] synthase-3